MGGIVSDLLGGPDVDRSALKNFQPIGVRAGGLTAGLTRLPGQTTTRRVRVPGSTGGGLQKGGINNRQGGGFRTITDRTQGPQVIDITSSPERQGLVSDAQTLFRQQADEVASLRDEALSGLGILGEARQGRIEDARRRTVGNLRENLSRRRVLGSSFGQDAISRAEAEFARQSAEAEGRTALEQLEIKSRLIDREFGFRQQAVQTALGELNFQSKIAASLATGATNALQASAQAQAALASEQASGLGELIGSVGGIGLAGALGAFD